MYKIPPKNGVIVSKLKKSLLTFQKLSQISRQLNRFQKYQFRTFKKLSKYLSFSRKKVKKFQQNVK